VPYGLWLGHMTRCLALPLLCLVLAVPAKAIAQSSGNQGQAATGQAKPADPPADTPQEPEPQKYEDQVVVTASRVEQKLVNAPATVTLISAQTLASSPSASYAELLRAVPGMNVTQTSARDINLVSRSASGTLSTSQLALIDGRSIYQDFFGFVAWDFLPVNPSEIKQIEVIRGPASAVWGANALTGVVNVITKSPRELVGDSLLISVGTFGRGFRDTDRGNGSLFSISGSHAAAPSDEWAYKITAGFATQDALGRPTGLIPNATNTPYPDYANTGTSQPKFDVRVDRDFAEGGQKLVFAGGFAGTEGMIHTGIGPFDIDRGTYLAYGKVNYSRGTMKVNAFVNHLDGDATNRLSRDTAGTFIPFSFKNTTIDVEASDVRTFQGRHVVSFGGNVRHNMFDLSLAPRGDSRTEAGVYGQDEIFINDHFRAVIGARVDKFSSIDGAVFSPRLTFMYKPEASQTVRVSFNRAYRAPSHVNNYLDVTLANALDLGALNPALAGRQFIFPVRAIGNEDLKEEKMTAYELGYTGIIRNRATVSAAFYVNDTDNSIFFTQSGSYRATNPPPGWPISPLALELILQSGRFGPGNGLPSTFTYLNLGAVRQKGVELGVEGLVTNRVTAFVNYSFQPEPEPEGFDISELNLPSQHHFNVGASYDGPRWLGNLGVSYASDAFWQDVLDSRFHGSTEGFTIASGAVGYKWRGDRLVTSLKISNIFNEEILQHVFGDVTRRQVVGELKVAF
jgi:outer membrane receptor protein involved in Fe transport